MVEWMSGRFNSSRFAGAINMVRKPGSHNSIISYSITVILLLITVFAIRSDSQIPGMGNPGTEIRGNPAGYEKVVVTRHVDGDTVHVEDASGNDHTVRFIGIDCPETAFKKDPYGKEASDFTKAHLLGKTVYLEKDVSETDKYGRLLRYVWVELPESAEEDEIRTKMFNAVLVLEGYAMASTYPPDVKYQDCFTRYQREAAGKSSGLWGL